MGLNRETIRNAATFPRQESGCARTQTDAPCARPGSFRRTNPPPVESPIVGVRPLPPARGIGQGNQRLESRGEDSEYQPREQSRIVTNWTRLPLTPALSLGERENDPPDHDPHSWGSLLTVHWL